MQARDARLALAPAVPAHGVKGDMLARRPIGSTGMQASILGLGCSRLGSIFGGDDTATRTLFAAARDTGVTFFDTADIYGQGDSERLIGRLLPRTGDIVVATKIGQRWPLALRSIRFLKTPLGPVLRSVPRARHTV